MNNRCIILAIESSCDDTSVAISHNDNILANVISSQHIHEVFGGVVPELASRAHLQQITQVCHKAVEKANISLSDIHAIAYTRGPGLLGSLLVGASFAKALSVALNIPLIEVNHLEAHILAHFIAGQYDQKPAFPMLCLTVSGGHTQLIKVKNEYEFKLLGQTIDDAAGEAFDKAAKIIGLPYPGGALIEKLAINGDANKFELAIPRIPEFDFSFSGLKTSFLYLVNKQKQHNESFIAENQADLAASMQQAIIKHLMSKTKTALEETGPYRSIALAGGVSANKALRKSMDDLAKQLGLKSYAPRMEYCTDNAGMIAIAAWYKFQKQEFCDLSAPTLARMPVKSI